MVMLRRPWVGEADGRGRGFVVVALSGPWVCCPKKKLPIPDVSQPWSQQSRPSPSHIYIRSTTLVPCQPG